MSRFATIKKGDYVADLCSGSGIVGIHLFLLNQKAVEQVELFEMQNSLYELSVKTIKDNNLTEKVGAFNTKVQDIDRSFNGKFSLVVCNPPYFEPFSGIVGGKSAITVCTNEITLTLSELCKEASRMLKFGGRFAMCYKSDRLCNVIREMQKNNIEPKRLQFVYAGKNDTPYLILIEGVKGGKSSIKILPNLRN